MSTRKQRMYSVVKYATLTRLNGVPCSEGYYASIKDDPELHVKLTGSWETVVGEQDTFCMSSMTLFVESFLIIAYAVHILEYENYSGYDKTTAKIRTSEVGQSAWSLC